jgi:hypothetical protein
MFGLNWLEIGSKGRRLIHQCLTSGNEFQKNAYSANSYEIHFRKNPSLRFLQRLNFFTETGLLALCSNPQPGGVPISVAFYDMHGLQWVYSFPRSPRREYF